MAMPRSFARLGRYVNPVLGRLAPTVPPLAMLHHVGRRSGRAYRTPVQAFPTERGWVIALVYGDQVDWVRNVFAGGGGELVRRRRRYRLTEPRRVDGRAGRRLLPWWSRALMGLVRVDEFVELAATPPATPPAAAATEAQGQPDETGGLAMDGAFAPHLDALPAESV